MSLIAIHRKIMILQQQMAAAAAADDFETAARLRDAIAILRGQALPSAEAPAVRKPPPGQMGLGTNIPVAAPRQGWTPPKKPDPLTKNVKSRKR